MKSLRTLIRRLAQVEGNRSGPGLQARLGAMFRRVDEIRTARREATGLPVQGGAPPLRTVEEMDLVDELMREVEEQRSILPNFHPRRT